MCIRDRTYTDRPSEQAIRGDPLAGHARDPPSPGRMWPSRRTTRTLVEQLVSNFAATAEKSSRTLAHSKERRSPMKVWIDQDLCTGDGLCEEICPSVFTLLDDGLAYVKQGDEVLNSPGRCV